MLEIYLVYGETGEYNDRQDWNVKAFADKIKAEEFKTQLNAWCEFKKCTPKHDTRKENLKCPFDPNFYCDWPGTEYSVETVPYEG